MYSSSLKGKNAWVTGSSRGIGRIVAEFLAECGANVAIHGRNATNLAQYGEGETLEAVAEEMAERFGVRIVPVCGNLGREEEAARAAATVRSKLGDAYSCIADFASGYAAYGGDRAVPLPGLSPLEHVGKPEDIASLVHFLCSEGGRYISGQCIRVDGGEQLSPC